MPRRTWTVPAVANGLRSALLRLAGLIEEPIVSIPVWTAGAEVADVRRLGGQVRDRLSSPADGRWLVLYWLTNDAGAPVAPTAVTVATGQDLGQAGAGSGLRLAETDAAGLLEIDVEMTGAANRRVRSCVLGPVAGSVVIPWA